MIKILFVCLGNICRSPMAEIIFKYLVKREGLENDFSIDSAGTSNEEVGNSMYYPAKRKLNEMGIEYENHIARQLTKKDYQTFDYIIAMEERNIVNIRKIIGNDTENKVYRLLDFTNNPRDIADPWYTGDFDVAYNEIFEGCKALLDKLKK